MAGSEAGSLAGAKPAAIAAMATPSGRHRSSCGGGSKKGVNQVKPSMDWPLSREEKRVCALKLYERDVRAADEMLEEREWEVGELRKELKVLRRLSSSSTRLSSGSTGPESSGSTGSADSPPAPERWPGEEAQAVIAEAVAVEAAARAGTADSSEPAQSPVAAVPAVAESAAVPQGASGAQEPELTVGSAGGCPVSEEKLLGALVRYLRERRGVSDKEEGPPEPSPDLVRMAKRDSQSEAAAADLWSVVGLRHDLLPVDRLMWLARSMATIPPNQASARPLLWRQSLLLPGQGPGGSGQAPRARCEAYLELRARASQLPGEAAEALRTEVESELRAAWRGEAFMAKPGIAEAVASICLSASAQRARHVRGSAEVAALLLFALLPAEAGPEAVLMAEADAFWSLAQLLTEVKGGLADDCHDGGGAGGAAAAAATASRARRCQVLLRAHDPAIAELLAAHGLAAFPSARLGSAFCTRAGFTLESCTQLWDLLLADGQRFGFCDFIVVALLLLHRADLLRSQGDAAGMAEVLLSSARKTSVDELLRTALALRAMERRRRTARAAGGQSSATSVRTQSQPPEDRAAQGPGVVEALGSLWSKVRVRGAGAIEAGRSAVRCAFPQVQQERGGWQEAGQRPLVNEEELQPLRRRNRVQERDN